MYSTLEKVKIVEIYKATKSVVVTQRKFCQLDNARRSPPFKTIKSIVVIFKTKDSVLNQQKGRSGRSKEFRTVE